jgi:hypothetical protein
MINVSLSLYSILIGFGITNTHSNDATRVIAVYVDADVGGNSTHYIGCLNEVSCFDWPDVAIVSGLSSTLSADVIAGDYPMTSQLSTYWYSTGDLLRLIIGVKLIVTFLVLLNWIRQCRFHGKTLGWAQGIIDFLLIWSSNHDVEYAWRTGSNSCG